MAGVTLYLMDCTREGRTWPGKPTHMNRQERSWILSDAVLCGIFCLTHMYTHVSLCMLLVSGYNSCYNVTAVGMLHVSDTSSCYIVTAVGITLTGSGFFFISFTYVVLICLLFEKTSE